MTTGLTPTGPALLGRTVDDILAGLRVLKEKLGPPEPEHVIVTPTMDALREACPMLKYAANPVQPFIGIRVVVCPDAPRVMLVPVELAKQNPHLAAGLYTSVTAAEPIAQADTPTVVEPG
ncbi:MAG TPA: hypothetical protein VD866_12900 [Urbifossiella sp.]|nr:hypothetical protein [Urbifossiella sp.]